MDVLKKYGAEKPFGIFNKNLFLAPVLALGLAACGGAKDHADESENSVASGHSSSQSIKAAATPPAPSISDVRARPIEDDIVYFLLPDRFFNGDTGNDRGGISGGKLDHGFDPTHKGFYHGGDIPGVLQKLDYLENLGVTAIWMAPIFKNKPVQGPKGQESAAYHGYWITDFTQIDPHFGTNQDLKNLVSAAHQRGIKIIFDIITNHTADVIQYRECQGTGDCSYRSLADYPYTTLGSPDGPAINKGFKGDGPALQTAENFAHLTDTRWAYTPFVPKAETDVKVPHWLNDPIYYHNRGNFGMEAESALNGDFSGLDDLFTEHPRVLSGMTEIYKYWIEEFGIDGFRIDTTRHVNMSFWQSFIPEIRAFAASKGIENFYVFGEVYDPDPNNLSRFVREGKLPAVLDFGFQSVAQKVLVENGPTRLLAQLFDQDTLYDTDWSHAGLLPTFLGNHDMGRLGHFLISQFGADADEDMLMKRVRLAYALMYFARGVPVIYYGDEQGFTGDGRDQDAREDMFPSLVDIYNDNRLLGSSQSTAIDNFDTKHPLYRTLVEFAALYHRHPALRQGKQITRYAKDSPGLFAFSRKDRHSGKEVLVVLNTARNADSAGFHMDGDIGAKRWVRLMGDGSVAAKGDGASVTATLPALSFGLWTSADEE
ncbi:alpha-amylase [Iodidimonas muriae]|uniref:Alpha-amylase n=1 Tax=Iodidimonas muriae TaxID=261467 RepID=A0ABQ2L5X0_9PROT|nr:alpha-amylase family glycosyl hydrolase [Iodidimonas muriae]GER06418.1 alpha-amylase [Kordiimonadales bacterium JCM 17843]GGO04683.1 alpha-amylase [Iodidimonas muriae]